MSHPGITLVVGATGLLGSEIVRLLRDMDRPVRALVRTTSASEKRASLEAWGAEVVLGDLKDPVSLADACRDVTTVISTASASASHQAGDTLVSVDHEGQLSLVDAARNAKAQRFVFVSFPPISMDSPFQRAKRAVEARIRESGLAFAILRPTFFTEVWLSPALGFDPTSGSARVFGTGEQRVRWISIHDVARFAVAASQSGHFDNEILTLGGPEPLSQLDVIKIFEDLGATMRREFVPVEVLEQQLRSAPDSVAQSLIAVALLLARDELGNLESSASLLPGRMSTVRDHALRLLSPHS
jgi:uncharacterized protein YbjT (DUF2867 family)